MRTSSDSLLTPVLITPALAFLIGAFFFPVGQILILSIAVPDGVSIWANFARLFEDGYYATVAWRTLRLSTLIAFFCVLIGFPLAYAISKSRPWVKLLLLIITVLPLMTSVVIRTFGWMILFSRGGPVSSILKAVGFSPGQSVFMHTEHGLVIAMVQVMLPFMVLTTLGVLNSIHPNLEESSRTMGAGFYRTMRHVLLPLSASGIASGAILVFTLSISSFVTPNLVGGVRLPVMAGAIYQQATRTLDWNFAAAQSALLLGGVMLLLLPYLALTRRRNG